MGATVAPRAPSTAVLKQAATLDVARQLTVAELRATEEQPAAPVQPSQSTCPGKTQTSFGTAHIDQEGTQVPQGRSNFQWNKAAIRRLVVALGSG